MSSSVLQKNILATLAYYDVMDYPMTAFEIWKYLTVLSDQKMTSDEQCSLADVILELENKNLKRFIEELRGFYFLKGRKFLVEQRIKRNKISERKFKKLRRAVWVLRFVPFVRIVMVAGRLAMKNTEEKSDMDLMVVLKHGRIFTGRFLVTSLLHLLGLRRHGKKIKNRVCLNHFVTYNFAVSIRDIFSAHEYAFLMPIFVARGFGEFTDNLGWIKRYKPNFYSENDNLKLIRDSRISRYLRNKSEKVADFDWVEKVLKSWQIRRIRKNPLTKQDGGIIIYNDEELAFWPNFENQGPKVFLEFKKRLEGLIS